MIDYGFFININHLEHLSYLGIFILLAVVGFIVPIPEEIMLLSVGYLSALGLTNVYITTGVGLIGVLTGDSFLFWLSRRGSRYIDKIQEKFKEGKLLEYKNLMRDNISRTVFLLRFIIGVRLFGPILAGALKAKWITFLVYDTLTLIIYVPVFVFLGYHFHNQLALFISELTVIRYIIFFIVIVIFGVGVSALVRSKFLKRK